MSVTNDNLGQSRRAFLAGTTALAGASAMGAMGALGLPGAPAHAAAVKRHPKRGGTLRFGTRDDSVGLDTHRHIIYFVSHPLTGTSGGLLDFNAELEAVPGIATEWDHSKDLKTWSFRLRRGAEFHNGETIDAQAVKRNYERIMDPKIGHSFTRSSPVDVERVTLNGCFEIRRQDAAIPSNAACSGLAPPTAALPRGARLWSLRRGDGILAATSNAGVTSWRCAFSGRTCPPIWFRSHPRPSAPGSRRHFAKRPRTSPTSSGRTPTRSLAAARRHTSTSCGRAGSS
jgi:hypothetical protein